MLIPSRIPRRMILAAAAAAALVSGPVFAQEPPLELTRLRAPIVLDGMPDEPAWQEIEPLPLTMHLPVFRGTPTQRTELRVAYDDEYFYAAGWFYDTDPSGIRINSLYRDRWNGDDAFAIYIDAFNDNRNAKWFGITPAGMRFDQLVSDDGATLNENWDAFWNARARVTDAGWFVEVRIPFSTIGFRADEQGRAVMGLTLTRLVSRLGERVTFPAIDPAFPFRRPSLARDVVLTSVRSRKPVYVTPYALAGAQRQAVPGGGGRTLREEPAEIGVDVRYPLSGRLTLDLTVNTDFAQVEADAGLSDHAAQLSARGQSVDIQIAGFRARTALDATRSANLLVQYNSTTRRVDVNVRLRYAAAEGRDLWLVYNEGLDAGHGDRPGLGIAPAPRSLSRAFILKYTYTFGFGL